MSTGRLFSNAVRIAVGAEVYAPGAVNMWSAFLRSDAGEYLGAALSSSIFKSHIDDWIKMLECERCDQPFRRDAQIGCAEAGWPDVGDRYWVDEGPNA